LGAFVVSEGVGYNLGMLTKGFQYA
jgi:hypothetical protein